MKSIQAKYLVLAGGIGLLLASFMAMAAMNNGIYVSISHMSALLYLLPALGLLATASGFLKPTAQINMSLACLCIGGLALVLTLYAGNQAKDQLNAFAQMSHELQVRRSQFQAEFDAGWNKGFPNQRQELQEAAPGGQRTETVDQAKASTIPEPEKASFGMGFYLAILSSIGVMIGGRLMQRQENNTEGSLK